MYWAWSDFFDAIKQQGELAAVNSSCAVANDVGNGSKQIADLSS